MRWRLICLAIATVGILVLVLVPMFTLQVKVDLPPATPSAAPVLPGGAGEFVGLAAEIVGNWILFSIVAGVLVLATLTGIGIVRRYRR